MKFTNKKNYLVNSKINNMVVFNNVNFRYFNSGDDIFDDLNIDLKKEFKLLLLVLTDQGKETLY